MSQAISHPSASPLSLSVSVSHFAQSPNFDTQAGLKQALIGQASPVALSIHGGVAIHGKHADDGRATLHFVGQRSQLLLSGLDPTPLKRFLSTFAFYVSI